MTIFLFALIFTLLAKIADQFYPFSLIGRICGLFMEIALTDSGATDFEVKAMCDHKNQNRLKSKVLQSRVDVH